ncbi:MAG TPA: hypothetical protein VFS21_06630, partial [Roseiflexaceae bacterium]|nr:hypothetical protein [Roseiflexaceae bacterium]
SWAMGIIGDCGPEGADALAHALRGHRAAQTRTAELDEVASVAVMLVDAEVFRQALEIAADQTAGEAARVHAISIIHAQVTGAVLPYEALVTDPVTDSLIIGFATTSQPLVVRALPTDARETALAVLGTIARQQQNAIVRLAAEQAFYSIQAE